MKTRNEERRQKMKNVVKRRIVAGAALAVLTLSLLPTPADARSRGFSRFLRADTNIVERLERSGQFNILLTALDTAGLTETVATAELTVLAPTDTAFANLLEELNIEAGDLLASPDLTNILLYHVLGGKNGIGRLMLGSTATTLYEQQPVLITLQDRRFKINDATVLRPNIRASNGYIQAIDSVLLPPAEMITLQSTLDVLRLDGRFSILLTAIETAGLEDAVRNNELTLFAPTDDAFVALLGELGISAGDLLANPDLDSILLYHVVGGEQRAFNLLLQGSAETLQGGDVFVNFSGGVVEVNDSTVIVPNIKTPTGVIHVIDAVLLP
jgi:uncharacterized surface protein with fasciclin (FAS1) repeats